MEKLKIMVTGGAGFIGSNLCERFLEEGHFVTCLDNFSTGHIENISTLLKKYPDNFKLITGDIRDSNLCLESTRGIDCIFHEAALGSIPRSIDDPKTTNDVNIGGFLNMLIAARDNHIKKFIFASSSSVYGDNQELPKNEDKIGIPLSPYALTKRVDELYADVFSKTYDINFIGLRYFNVFGKRQDPNSPYAAVIPIFIRELINHRSPSIYGDGANSRDFTYIDNVIHMNKLALEASSLASNKIYNTATETRTNINSLFKNIKDLLSELDIEIQDIMPSYKQGRIGEIQHSLASVERARTLLGYEPIISFQDGLKETINWYWDYFKNYKL